MDLYAHTDLAHIKSYIPPCSSLFVIIDRAVKSYLKEMELPECKVIAITADEHHKSLGSVERIYKRLLKMGADRESFIIGIGGGVVSDIAGFVAATYMRGVRFGLVPTTPLAQADAAVGGKNGVNLLGYKNIIGTIRQGEWIYLSSRFFATLSQRQLCDGFTEILKTFIITDGSLYRESADFFASYNSLSDSHKERLNKIIATCAAHKLRIVESDQFERGCRRFLNLGHTFGHAIERIVADSSDNEISHGEAVSIGLMVAAKLSLKIGKCGGSFVAQLTEDFNRIGLPTESPYPLNLLAEYIGMDKKRVAGKIHFILPLDFGKVEDYLVDMSLLKKMITEL